VKTRKFNFLRNSQKSLHTQETIKESKTFLNVDTFFTIIQFLNSDLEIIIYKLFVHLLFYSLNIFVEFILYNIKVLSRLIKPVKCLVMFMYFNVSANLKK